MQALQLARAIGHATLPAMFTLGECVETFPTLLAVRKPQAHCLIQAVGRGVPADKAELVILGHVEEMLRKYLRMVNIEDLQKKDKGPAFDTLHSFVGALVSSIGYQDMVMELVFVEALLKPLECDLDYLVAALEKADEDASENIGPILKPYVTWPIGKRIVELAVEALEFRETEREVLEHVEKTRVVLAQQDFNLLKLKECVVLINHATLKARSANSLPQKLRDDLDSLEEEVQLKVLAVVVSPLGAALSAAVVKAVEGQLAELPSMSLPKDKPCELTLFDFHPNGLSPPPHVKANISTPRTHYSNIGGLVPASCCFCVLLGWIG